MMNMGIILGEANLAPEDMKALEAAINTIQNLLGVTTKKKHYEPKDGELYHYMWGTGKTDTGTFSEHSEKDLMRVAMGNCFKTAEERDAAVEYLMIVAELKRFAYDYNDEIDWDDYDQKKYKLCYNRETDEVTTTWSKRKITDGIYFSSHEIAMDAVEAVGEDRIRRYYLPDAE